MAHRPKLLEYASDIPDKPAAAEDMAQMARGRYAAVTRQRRLAEPLTYLYRIRHKLAIDSYRRQRRESIMEPGAINSEQTIANKTPTPEAATTIRHELRLLEKALAELPERSRIALEMRQIGGHTFKEIAAHIGLSVTRTHAIIAAARSVPS